MKHFHKALSLATLIALSTAANADLRRTDRMLDRPLTQQVEHGTYRDIEAINQRVNAMHLNNCKVYVWEKIGRLNDLGITAAFMVVRTETGGAHAIAVVDKRLALDSRYNWVMTLDQLRAEGYSITPLKGNLP